MRKLKNKLRRRSPEELIEDEELFISEADGEDVEHEEEVEERQSEIKKVRYSRSSFIATLHTALFLINATLITLLAGMIVKVAGIAGKYEQRIFLINPDYVGYIDMAYYVAAALFLYAVFNAFIAAYYFYESRGGV